MVNNQLKNMKNKSLTKRKNTFKKNGSLPGFFGSPESQVDPTDRPSLTIFLLLLVFHLTRIGPTIKSINSILTCQIGLDLITMSWHISFSAYSSLKKETFTLNQMTQY